MIQTRITRPWLRAQSACYTDERIAELVPAEGLTLSEVLGLPTPAQDRVWVATRPGALTPQLHATFARGCADRAHQYALDAADAYYADYAADAADAANAADAAYRVADAAYCAYYAADAAYSSYRAADAAVREWQAQIDHLKILATLHKS